MPAPQTPLPKKTKAIAMHLQGESNVAIAKAIDVHPATVASILKTADVRTVSSETSIERALAKAGLTHETIAAKFAELMEAKDVRLASFEGKFTDRVDVPDSSIQHRATESIAKIAGMFPKEDATATAALFVKMPMTQLVTGHGATCMCRECATAWEEQTASALLPTPDAP